MATKNERGRLTRARELCERAKALARNARRAEAELAAAMLLEIEREGAHRATPTEPRRQQTQRIVASGGGSRCDPPSDGTDRFTDRCVC